MSSPIAEPTIKIKGETPIIKERTYTLFYHYRASAPQSLVFVYSGTFQEAVERARVFCTRCGYRFIIIRPFIVDLDEREKRISDGFEDT